MRSASRDMSNRTRPIAILRDERLVLPQSQAYFEASRFADCTASLNDVRAGDDLAPHVALTSLAAGRTVLPYERRISPFGEAIRQWGALARRSARVRTADRGERAGRDPGRPVRHGVSDAERRGGCARRR